MPRRKTTAEQMSRYEVDSETDCWNWTGALNNSGYGVFGTTRGGKRKTYLAHRESYKSHFGQIPDGLLVLHKCKNNRRCINPRHLYVGTQSDNMRDRVRDGNDPHANRTRCPQGHELAGDNLRAAHARRGRRNCLTCSRERNRETAALIKAARERLGLTYTEYVARYGQSAKTARAILATAAPAQLELFEDVAA